MKEGSLPSARSAATIIAVVVVLPWVPVTPSAGVIAVIAANNAGRSHTSAPAWAAATSSGSLPGTAEEATTRSQSAARSGW